jgi:hypothetical protein
VTTLRIQGRDLSEADLMTIRRLREEHPDWSRVQLSQELAQQWQWRNATGRLKDMAARTLLLKLQARGWIDLPAPRTRNGNSSGERRARRPVQESFDLGLSWNASRIEGPLSSVGPVSLDLVESLEQRRRVAGWLRQYHFRGSRG